jgi:hypothetical protein
MFWRNRVSSDVLSKPPDLPDSIDNPGDIALSEQYIWVRKRLHWGRYKRMDVASGDRRIEHPFKAGWMLTIGYEDNDRRMAYPTWVKEGRGEQKFLSGDEMYESKAVDADETNSE